MIGYEEERAAFGLKELSEKECCSVEGIQLRSSTRQQITLRYFKDEDYLSSFLSLVGYRRQGTNSVNCTRYHLQKLPVPLVNFLPRLDTKSINNPTLRLAS
jgi:hypothetical protein